MKTETAPLKLTLQKTVIAIFHDDESPSISNNQNQKLGPTTGSCLGCETIEDGGCLPETFVCRN